MIQGSVGDGGRNLHAEVVAVQRLLNDWLDGVGGRQIAVDGIVGPETIGAIKACQQANRLLADGRVDVGGPTLRFLDQYCAVLHHTKLRLGVSGAEALLTQMGPAQSLQPRLRQALGVVKEVIAILKAPTGASAVVSANHNASVVGFVPTLPVFGAALVIPPALVVLLVLIMLLLVITGNPVWQRSARQFVDELIRRISKAMARLSDEIEQTIKDVEETVRKSGRCAMLCSDELIAFRQISLQVLNELRGAVPSDPIRREQWLFRLSNLVKRWQMALEALLECFARNGCQFG